MSGMLASKLDLPLQSTFDFIFSPKAQSVDTHPLWDILGKDFENEDAHTHTHTLLPLDQRQPLGKPGEIYQCFFQSSYITQPVAFIRAIGKPWKQPIRPEMDV